MFPEVNLVPPHCGDHHQHSQWHIGCYREIAWEHCLHADIIPL